MRRAAKVDSTHHPLVKLARQLGCYVMDTSALGAGRPDVMVARIPSSGQFIGVEFKSHRGHLTPDQKRLHAQVKIHVWKTESDVLAHCGVK
jgi:hypothetical protein